MSNVINFPSNKVCGSVTITLTENDYLEVSIDGLDNETALDMVEAAKDAIELGDFEDDNTH